MSMNFSDLFGGGGVKPWVSGATYAAGKVVQSPADNYQLYVRVVAGAGATDPSADSTNWVPFGARARKSIQRGVTSGFVAGTTLNITISSVDVSKASVRFLGWRNESKSVASYADVVGVSPTFAITSPTNLQARMLTNTAGAVQVSWEVEETY